MLLGRGGVEHSTCLAYLYFNFVIGHLSFIISFITCTLKNEKNEMKYINKKKDQTFSWAVREIMNWATLSGTTILREINGLNATL